MPYKYITASVVGKFPYLLISSNSEVTPIQIFQTLNSGFLVEWWVVELNPFLDINFMHHRKHFGQQKKFY